MSGDVADLVAAYGDPDIRRWHARTMDEEEAAAFIAGAAVGWSAETSVQWAIAGAGVGSGNEFLGRIALRVVKLDDGMAEVAYWVTPSARGKGVAPSALRLLTDWSLHDLGLHRLELLHSTLNDASCRVAVKCGFSLEGIKQSDALHEDGWHDMHLHAIVSVSG